MSLIKRGRVWWVDVTENGKRVRTPIGQCDKKIAQRIYNKILGEIAEGKWFKRLPGEDKTFKEMMERFLSEHASKKASEKAFQTYVRNLLPFFGDYKLSEITPKFINEFKAKRRRDGLKPASINRELACMKKAFNLAIKEWEWVDKNPLVVVSMEEENNKRDRWLIYEEEERLLEVCSGWLKEIVIFALNTGMRLDEILSLNWKDIDLPRRTVMVVKSKNKERRTIPLNSTVLELVKAKSKIRSIQTNLVFYNKNFIKIDKCIASRGFHSVAKKG
jgi:integrase